MAIDESSGPGVQRRVGGILPRARAAASRVVRQLVILALVAGMSLAAGLFVVMLANEYGYHPVRNAATWASQPVQFALGGECAGCHPSEAAAISQRNHATIGCQTCHGPLAEHARTGRVALASTTGATSAEPATCVACHEAVLGRPLDFPVVTTLTHFGGSPCVLCHDPHATVALAPPPVRHALDQLPDCLVCHGPSGLRPMPEQHPVWPDGDCLGCHLRRGAATP